jgi:Na+/H+ antiporter NhaD/arsenite permease-like protein
MTATPAMAGEALDGARLPWPLALPFAGMLLSIALGPLAVKEWWHIHYAKAAGFWAILALGGLIAVEGLPVAAASFVHSMALEYLPFILMLFALFTAAGGIAVEGRLNGSAPVNTTILAFGTMIASVIGPIVPSLILIPFVPTGRAPSTPMWWSSLFFLSRTLAEC